MIKTPIQVRFNDMDPMRRVNNSSYSTYLEVARMDFCNRFFQIETLDDTPFVLVRVEMDLLRSMTSSDKAEVHTWVTRIGSSSWEFTYKIVDPVSQKVFVQAKSVQVYFNYRTGNKELIPKEVREILEKEMN